MSPPAPEEGKCYSTDTVYDGDDTCHPGGEIVTVRRVVDGDTLELTDGRTVRLLGVDAPEADTCAGPGATEYTRSLVESKKVKLYREPGVETDQYDRLLRYVQLAGQSTERGTSLPIYSHDLGNDLVLNGWALPFWGDANLTYMKSIESAKGIAEYQPQGMYAPPCGEPAVYGDDDGNGVPEWEEEGNVNAPNVNLPDGALTGGYCAKKWWC